MTKIIAMIPARLGSKRVKNKNLRLLDGKPLVAHVAATALQSKVFDEIYINSESDVFEPLAKEIGVSFYQRPLEFATDDATNDQFVLDFIDNVQCDIIVQINPTSPLLTVDDVQSFVSMMLDESYDTLHTVKEEQIECLFDGMPLNFDPERQMPRSQDLKAMQLFVSSMMAWRVKNYRDNIEQFGAGTYGGDGKIGYFTLDGFSTIDIDHEEDFVLAELAIARQKVKDVLEPQYYQIGGQKLRAETDVGDILQRDGVAVNDLKDENNEIVNLKNIIDQQDNTKSWSKRIINTENNSATLISQLPGEGNRLHHHNDWNEWWYIVAGEWDFEIEGTVKTVTTGDVVLIKKNRWHKITAKGTVPAVRLAVSKDKVAHIYKSNESRASEQISV